MHEDSIRTRNEKGLHRKFDISASIKKAAQFVDNEKEKG